MEQKMDRSKAVILLSVIAVAALLGGSVLTVYASEDTMASNGDFAPRFNGDMLRRAFRNSRGFCQHGFVEVSEEFEEQVLNIANDDEDVKDLLANGYDISGIRPIIKAFVDGDGNVESKVTSAIVILTTEETGRASVWVDLAEAKVTKIMIVTRQIIEK
jgi:hypothetical protein